MHPATGLRELLASGETVVMPDAYDPLSARTIEKLGFPAVQCSGFSIALSECEPEPTFGFERNLAATAAIVAAVAVPVMADGEDGFADVAATVKAYLEAGVAGINIEDQVLGAPGPKRLIPLEAAVQAGVPDLIINGRTDALTAGPTPEEGLREAIARANAYLQAGADMAFVIGVATVEQAQLVFSP